MEENSVFGAEGIIIHGDKIVLGMQKQKRWYPLENGEQAAIVKTIGGAMEEQDDSNTRKTLIREVLEEVNGISENDIKVSKSPVFTKEIKIGELNPYEKSSELKMKADFYVVEIPSDLKLKPNDLPALIEVPKEQFFKLNLSDNSLLREIKKYIIKSEEVVTIPENYAIMAPKEIKDFLINREEQER